MRGSGKGGMRDVGCSHGRTPRAKSGKLGLGRRAWGMKEGALKGVDQKSYYVQDQERGGGRSEVGKQRVKVRGVGRED